MTAEIAETLRFARQFRGPRNSGNGGYVAGTLARLHPATVVTVTLRQPPPLERGLAVESDADALRLLDGSSVVAEATAGEIADEPPEVMPPREAAAAQALFPGLREHPFPECFVCGLDRDPSEALCLRPGVFEPGHTACRWTPADWMATASGSVDPRLVWAALDCPGGWTADLLGRPMVLGRFTVELRSTPRPGEDCVVVGAALSSTGRKMVSDTALWRGTELLAQGRAVWISVDPTTFNL